MTLQQQMALSEPNSPTETQLNARLARIFSKLFNKVMKAEEGSPHPFAGENIDLQSLLCAMEDMLNAAEDAAHTDGIETGSICTDMGETIMTSIVERGGFAIYEIQAQLEQLGIDPHDSSLAVLLQSAAPSLPSNERSFDSSRGFRGDDSPDVAVLVSNVGTATTEEDRQVAVNELRKFRDTRGNQELDAYLGQVSGAFRVFVLSQLEAKPESPVKEPSGIAARLRNLREKLNETESSFDAQPEPVRSFPASVASNTAPSSPVRSTRLPSPIKKKVSPPGLSATGSGAGSAVSTGSAAMNLRQRLAAAQGARGQGSRSVSSVSTTTGFTGTSDSLASVSTVIPAPAPLPAPAPAPKTGGSAAALRARLQAVKNQARGNGGR